jgi:hypothetical protein
LSTPEGTTKLVVSSKYSLKKVPLICVTAQTFWSRPPRQALNPLCWGAIATIFANIAREKYNVGNDGDRLDKWNATEHPPHSGTVQTWLRSLNE